MYNKPKKTRRIAMTEQELKTLIEKAGEDAAQEEQKVKKIEYMMDFGSVAIMVNVSLN
jgi:hypothetical protein